MKNLTEESKILLKNSIFFSNKNVLVYGDIKDNLPFLLPSQLTHIYITKYNIWKLLNNEIKNCYVHFNFKIKEQHCYKTDILIYYWPKDKKEAIFQLKYLFSCNFIKCLLIVVGKNIKGVRSAPKIINNWSNLKKLDVAKHCSIYVGNIRQSIQFHIEKLFNTYVINNMTIKILPGVFGYKSIDQGTLLLTSTFLKNYTGKVLDVGCGSGVLSILLFQISSKINLTLIDIDSISLDNCTYNLKLNNIPGKVLASDLFSNINEKFDLILSNPPLHEDIQLTTKIIKKLIVESSQYLNKNGELRFVTLSSLLFCKLLQTYFSKIKILLKNRCFIVYQAFL
ncbi:Ribosomal RNA small subunit methyltransferase C [Buchnera aphidicola (Eriosoma lanigerum)]